MQYARKGVTRKGELLSLLRNGDSLDFLQRGLNAARFCEKSLARDFPSLPTSPQIEELLLGTQSACVLFVLELAERSPEMRQVVLPFVQDQLTSPSLLHLLHCQRYSLKLLPFLALHVPALRACESFIPFLLSRSVESQVFAMHLIAALSDRYHDLQHIQQMARSYVKLLAAPSSLNVPLVRGCLPAFQNLARLDKDLHPDLMTILLQISTEKQ